MNIYVLVFTFLTDMLQEKNTYKTHYEMRELLKTTLNVN